MQRLSYRQAMQRSHKEAMITLASAVVLTIFFWSAVFFFEENLTGWLGLPIWFWVSCVGGYFFSIVIVWLLVSKVFLNFDLEDFKRE